MWRTALGFVLVGAWLGTAGGPGAQAAPAACGEPVAAPTYQVGETWTWREEKGRAWSATVIAIEGDLTQIKWDHGHVNYVDKDWVLQKIRRPDRTLVTTQGAGAYTQVGQRDLPFPATVGQHWTRTYMGQPTGGTIASYLLRYTVVACEALTLPAGTFPALKVQVDQSVMGRSGSGTFFQWYAPPVKMWVKKQYVPSNWFSGGRFLDYELIRFETK